MTKTVEQLKNFKAKVPVQVSGQWVQKTIFENGVELLDTVNGLHLGDCDSAQELFDSYSDELLYYEDIKNAYTERDERTKRFLGTYIVTPNLFSSYELFLNRFACNEYDTFIAKVLENEGHFPTFEDWKSGKIKVGSRTMKLGKWLQSNGITDELVSFYASQSKVGKPMYLTISDNPLHVLGMSTFGTDWDSCQGLHHSVAYNSRLMGSLNDTKLLVAFLHDKLEDIEDFDGKVLARTVMRLFKYEEDDMLFSTKYYGNSHNQKVLHSVLLELEALGIMSDNALNNSDIVLKEKNEDSWYELTMTHYAWVSEELEEWVDIECVACGGDGIYNAYFPDIDEEIGVECPACNGNGEIEHCVTISIDEEVECSVDCEVSPYNECYQWNTDIIRINVNSGYIESVYDSTIDTLSRIDSEPKVRWQRESNNMRFNQLEYVVRLHGASNDSHMALSKVAKRYHDNELIRLIALSASSSIEHLVSAYGTNTMLAVYETELLGNEGSNIGLSSHHVSNKGSGIEYANGHIDTVRNMIFITKWLGVLGQTSHDFYEALSEEGTILYELLSRIAHKKYGKF